MKKVVIALMIAGLIALTVYWLATTVTFRRAGLDGADEEESVGNCVMTDIGTYKTTACAGAETTLFALRVYSENDPDLPDWWDPDGPVAAEWNATVEDVLEADVLESFVRDIHVASKDLGCPDYDVEPTLERILDVPLDAGLQTYIAGLCRESGLPYTLAIAVIEQESNYTPWVVSDTDDWGLMQINAMCHDWLAQEIGITDFLDPYQSVRAGIYLLSGYWEKIGYESGVLMCYNMGETGASRLWDQGIYSTDYSDRVMNIKYRLDTQGK